MAFNVNSFAQNFKGKGEGARPTLFEVQINYGNVGRNLSFQCKAAQLPQSTVGVIEVPYFGRKIKIHGDRVYEPWTITVINDEKFEVRNSIERWLNDINSNIGNRNSTVAQVNYKGQATVTQFTKGGDRIKTYKMINCWPSEAAAIDVSWETTDTIEDFTVTLQYDWWEESNSTEVSA